MPITMTTENGNVKIYMAGSGALTIDWGDGTDQETHTLLEHNNDWFDREWNYQFAYTHDYSDVSSHTITITGKNITHLGCGGNELTRLDVSKNTELTSLDCWGNQLMRLDMSQNTSLIQLSCAFNPLTNLDISKNAALKELHCQQNQLTSLDVSRNIALTELHCSINQLTSLDVSKNTALTRLYCFMNQFTSLDMSKNTALIHLDCDKNLLTAPALDTLFGTLNDTPGTKTISIGDNPGTADCHKSIAKKKKWTLSFT